MKNELSKGIDIELGEEMAEGQYAQHGRHRALDLGIRARLRADHARPAQGPGQKQDRAGSRTCQAASALAARKHRPLRKLDRSDPDPQLVFRRNKTSHEFSRRRGLTRHSFPVFWKRTAAIRRRLRRTSRRKVMFRPRAVAKRLPGGLSSAAEIRRHINGTVST